LHKLSNVFYLLKKKRKERKTNEKKKENIASNEKVFKEMMDQLNFESIGGK